MRTTRIAAFALVLALAGSPVLAVVCGFVCQPAAMPMAAAAACHGEHGHAPADGAALTVRHGCDHQLPALLAMQAVQQAIAPAPAVTANAIAIALPVIARIADDVAYPPGASPPASIRPLVLRI